MESVLIDPSSTLGGVLRTDQIDGCTVEAGADSWLGAKPWARTLARELGVESDVIGSNDAMRKIQVLRKGKLVPFPTGMQLIVPKTLNTVWRSQLFDFPTKLRMTADRFRKPSGPPPERSVGAFVRDHFGQGAVDYLAAPLLSGIYGGDIERLSASSVLPKFVERERTQGSITRTASAEPVPNGSTFESMRGGLGQLCGLLAPERHIVGKAEALRRSGNIWQARVAEDWMDASQVIVATPAHAAAELVEGELGTLLATIQHSSAHIVAMAFRGIAPLPGFGMLVPAIEGHNLVATTWVSNKFSGRVPDGVQLIRAFFHHSTKTPLEEVRKVFPIAAEPLFVRDYEWPNSMPQYAVGHTALIDKIQSAHLPGLHLIGNAYQGVGIPDCIRLAKTTASAAIASVE